MKGRALRKATLGIALGMCIASMVPLTASAQAVNGAVVGRATEGDTITITNVATGLSRSTTAENVFACVVEATHSSVTGAA